MSVENPNFENEPASPESKRGMPTLMDNKESEEALGKKFEGAEIPKAINESTTMQKTREDLSKSYNGEKHKERQNEGPIPKNKEASFNSAKGFQEIMTSSKPPKKNLWQKLRGLF